ncbi:unnamed protein product [Sphagnum troendelagicum]|uniref:Uncharacterized protein n=1 Tax=Sphagnum troendelagicum TaxID=128251 RepID=A0ABP0U889_9BRYO
MDNKMKASIQSGKQTLELDSSGASEKKSTLAAWILQQLATATLKQTFSNILRSKKKEQYSMHFCTSKQTADSSIRT